MVLQESSLGQAADLHSEDYCIFALYVHLIWKLLICIDIWNVTFIHQPATHQTNCPGLVRTLANIPTDVSPEEVTESQSFMAPDQSQVDQSKGLAHAHQTLASPSTS